MAMVQFRGVSGRQHKFSAHRPDETFPVASAVYAFARPGFGGKGWVIVFLSRTANLAARLANHERWQEARLLGATHILVHQRDERDVREYVEADLLGSLKPVLNGAVLEAPADEPHEAVTPETPRRTLKLVWAA